MDGESRREHLRIAGFVAALAVITLLRFLYLRSLPGGGTFIKYLWFADEILAGRLHPDRLADLSPGYLWFLTALRWLDLGHWPIRGIQIAMVSAVAFCAGLVARRIGGWPAAIGAAILVLANRAALINASDFEPESLLLFFEAVAIAFVVRSSPPSRWSSALGGLAIGLAIMTRPVALLVAAVLGGILVWRSWRAWRVPLIYFVMAALPVAVVLGVNAKLTGDAVIMDPGLVFLEGMNPRTTGCGGKQPQIVLDLQSEFEGPDTMHVTYPVVASRAVGRELTREESNRWWVSKALAYVRKDPAGAAVLTLTKARSAIQSYDVWDVASMATLQRSMTAPFWIPWSVVLALCLAGLFVVDRRSAIPLVLLVCAAAAPLLLFYTTGRHRNPLLIPVAILGGIAIVRLWSELRGGRRSRASLALALGAVAAFLFSIETPCAHADDYEVRAGIEMRMYRRAAAEALERGDVQRSNLLLARARTVAPDSVPMVPRNLLALAAMAELGNVDDPQRLFRVAIALDDAGAAGEARRLYEATHEADPLPNRAMPAPSWYLARSYAREGDLAQARRWLALARQLAPFHPDTLAFAAVFESDSAAGEALFELHDPLTATLARNEAEYLLCRDDSCRRALDDALLELDREFPKWKRPRLQIEMRRGTDLARKQ